MVPKNKKSSSSFLILNSTDTSFSLFLQTYVTGNLYFLTVSGLSLSEIIETLFIVLHVVAGLILVILNT